MERGKWDISITCQVSGTRYAGIANNLSQTQLVFGPYTGSMSALNQEMLVIIRHCRPTVMYVVCMAGYGAWADVVRGERRP